MLQSFFSTHTHTHTHTHTLHVVLHMDALFKQKLVTHMISATSYNDYYKLQIIYNFISNKGKMKREFNPSSSNFAVLPFKHVNYKNDTFVVLSLEKSTVIDQPLFIYSIVDVIT